MSEEFFLVFDIETVALPFDGFDEGQQKYLLRGAQTDEEREKKIGELALSPLTSRVCCIGLQFMKRDGDGFTMVKRSAFALDDSMGDEDDVEAEILSDGSEMCRFSEKKILEKFWKIFTGKYSRVCLISFNGRGFDAPFLMLRSALHHIRPTRNLMDGTKFNYKDHTDLLDELCFYMPQQSGATRRYNFDFFAKAFGIVSPKAAGVDGSMVGELFKNGQLREISEYCLRDVAATWELYEMWHKYLRFEKASYY
jgi:DNA polymerase elongation subunit (family B)